MSSTSKMIKCIICGKEIEATTQNRRYCRECAIDVRNKRKPDSAPIKKETQCLNCGKTYRITGEWRSPNFCCDACGVNYRWKQKHGKTTPEKTLSDWANEAKACELDYGTYRGLIASGKTFEELKLN